MLYLTRKIEFAAAHVCRRPEWPDEQNRRVYGACAIGSGHGHDYVCDVTVKGPIDPRTGMVVNLVEVNRTLKAVVGVLNATHLNDDHPAFQERVPTTEWLTLVLWDRLQPHLERCLLHRIRLQESRTRVVEYRGEGSMVYVTRRIEFNAAHRLHSAVLSDEENAEVFGKCNSPNGHGHNYELEVTVRGPVDERTGTVIDLEHLDQVLEEEVMARYDHKNLNVDVEEFRTLNPTSEMFARVIWDRLAVRLADPPRALYRVRLVETSKNAFEYYGEQEP